MAVAGSESRANESAARAGAMTGSQLGLAAAAGVKPSPTRAASSIGATNTTSMRLTVALLLYPDWRGADARPEVRALQQREREPDERGGHDQDAEHAEHRDDDADGLEQPLGWQWALGQLTGRLRWGGHGQVRGQRQPNVQSRQKPDERQRHEPEQRPQGLAEQAEDNPS